MSSREGYIDELRDRIAAMKKEHQAALVRARNEGLEEAAKTLDCTCGRRDCVQEYEAAMIRAKKEPESCP